MQQTAPKSLYLQQSGLSYSAKAEIVANEAEAILRGETAVCSTTDMAIANDKGSNKLMCPHTHISLLS